MVGGVRGRDTELEQAVQQALHGYLASEGFSDPVVARTGGLIFQRGDVMLRFRRTDRGPTHPFEVQASIGLRRTADIVDWLRLARLSPEASIAHACWSWELPGLESLDVALARLRDEVLVPHVAAFWRQPSRLDPAIQAQDQEAERRFQAGVEQQNLRAARQSFQHGRFREAEQYFGQLGRLSEDDQRRQEIARGAVQRDRAQHDEPDERA
jgi:hypothetical protein